MDIEAERRYLKENYGISTVQELREANRKLKLNIGCFVSPVPGITPEEAEQHDHHNGSGK